MSFQKLRSVLIALFEMCHCSPRSAALDFLTTMTWRWDQLSSDWHQSPLCPVVYTLLEGTASPCDIQGKRKERGGAVGRIQTSSKVGKTVDHCCSLLDLGNYRHSHLAGGDGGDDTCPE